MTKKKTAKKAGKLELAVCGQGRRLSKLAEMLETDLEALRAALANVRRLNDANDQELRALKVRVQDLEGRVTALEQPRREGRTVDVTQALRLIDEMLRQRKYQDAWTRLTSIRSTIYAAGHVGPATMQEIEDIRRGLF